MKKLAIFLIFSFFMVFLLQQEVFAEIEGKEEREKAASRWTEKERDRKIEKENSTRAHAAQTKEGKLKEREKERMMWM